MSKVGEVICEELEEINNTRKYHKSQNVISEKTYNKNCITANKTLSDLIEEWLLYVKPDVKESTHAKYSFLYERHIKNQIGYHELNSLTSDLFDEFTHDLLTKGNIRDNSFLSPNTVANVLSVIKTALHYGYKHNHIDKNICINNPKIRNKKIETLSSYEISILIKKIEEENKPYIIGILLSLYMGLRIGEVCALKWSDINTINKTVNINKTISRILDINTHKSSVVISNPKSDNSNRIIPVPEFLNEYLLKVKRNNDYYVITGTKDYLEPRSYYRKYKKLLKKAGIEEFNYHALRHTFATKAVDSSFDIKTLSEILGHSSVELTLKKYVHPTMEMKRKQMNLIPSPFKDNNSQVKN